MAVCQEIKGIGDVESELTRLRDLLEVVYASITSDDRTFDEIKSGVLWMVHDIEDDVERIVAGIRKITEARTDFAQRRGQ